MARGSACGLMHHDLDDRSFDVGWPGHGCLASMLGAMRCSVGGLSLLLVAGGCHEPSKGEAENDEPPVDVQALLWCVVTSAVGGERADGEQVLITTKEVACLCLAVGTQPYTGSELARARIETSPRSTCSAWKRLRCGWSAKPR